MDAITSILKHEGFKQKPYIDPIAINKLDTDTREILIGVWDKLNVTIGHGLTYLTEEESALIVRGRVSRLSSSLAKEKYYFLLLPPVAQQVLIEMAYQLGIPGLLRFKRMWAAIDARDYAAMATEMLDSRWARQTPDRAKELADRVRSLV